ncbi:MAG: DUF2156 domain-containing protein [Akkermansia sp.]|nr:DUF2156 domain-containing protein [Akkermansia sp.]
MSNITLTFSAPTLKDYTAIRETLFHVEQSDLAFPNIFLLQRKYGTQIALHENYLYRYFTGNGRLQGYAFPVGKNVDVERALFHVEQHAKAHQNPLHFCLLAEENARTLKDIYGNKITFSDDPGDADYLYRRSDLAELPGTAYHKKRNHIAKFCKKFSHWHFEEINDKNAADAYLIAQSWVKGQDGSEAHFHELQAIKNALKYRHQLGIVGGLLYVENAPAAMSLASYITPSVADIHYEKCTPEYRESYPIINREMATMLHCDIINREEDLNIPGLRQAKLSYKPGKILHKLKARIDLC